MSMKLLNVIKHDELKEFKTEFIKKERKGGTIYLDGKLHRATFKKEQKKSLLTLTRSHGKSMALMGWNEGEMRASVVFPFGEIRYELTAPLIGALPEERNYCKRFHGQRI